jgi:hypothetical protein
MRPLVAHCHLGLGKHYRRAGEQQEAQEYLAVATTMYREMDMTYWLEQAERRWERDREAQWIHSDGGDPRTYFGPSRSYK